MKYRASLGFVGSGNAAPAYGGLLDAWSFTRTSPEDWFSAFRVTALRSIGQRYLPVYRMADGEYRFLMGRKFNRYRRPLWRELAAVGAERLRLRNPDAWKTSWGETYAPSEAAELRAALIHDIRYIAERGFLACYINDNGLHAFTEYNRHVEPYFESRGIPFNQYNYVPFHFVCALLTNSGWQEFYAGRNILVVSGTDDDTERLIARQLQAMGARSTRFIRISRTHSMKDRINLSSLEQDIDIGLVAAGIGAANILRQLAPLGTLVLDIGGYISCYIDPQSLQHGGVFGLPRE